MVEAVLRDSGDPTAVESMRIAEFWAFRPKPAANVKLTSVLILDGHPDMTWITVDFRAVMSPALRVYKGRGVILVEAPSVVSLNSQICDSSNWVEPERYGL